MARRLGLAVVISAAARLAVMPAAAQEPVSQPSETQPATTARADEVGPPASAAGPADDTPAAAAPPAATQPAPPAGGPLFPPVTQVLNLRRLELEAGFETSYDERAVTYTQGRTTARGSRQVDQALTLEETLGLSAEGSLFSDKIALFDTMVRYGLRQDRYRESGSGRELDEQPNGDLLEYDVALNLLPRGKISGMAFASRLDSRVPRAFQPSLDRTRERYGGTLLFNDAALPMRLSFEHVWDELTSRTKELLDDEQRGDDTLRYEATWQIARNHAVTFSYQYADRTEQYSGTRTRFDTYGNYGTLSHVLRFGEDDRSSWENLLRFQDETGDLARDQAEFLTRLRLQHSKALATNWAAQYYRDAFQELETATWRGEGGVTWQPLPELVTTAQFWGYQQQDDDNADFCELGTLLNASYARDNALGRFSANASYNGTTTDTRNGDRRGIVIGESVTFRDPLLAFLLQPDVDWSSIVVTDATRARTYLPGRDYVKIRVGRYTALRRVVTGQIPDRATVLVTYTYRLAEDIDIQRNRFDVRLQQDFKSGLSIYYAAALQDERVEPSTFVPWRDRNINRQRVGATFRRNRWSVGGEYEYNDDSIDPYQALHGNGDWVVWQAARHQLDAKLTGSQFWFRGADDLEERNVFLLDLGASYRYLLAQHLEANASALYRFEDDSLWGRTNGVDLTAAIDWRIGQFDLRFEAEYDLLDLPGARENSFAFWLKLKRTFPLINQEAQR